MRSLFTKILLWFLLTVIVTFTRDFLHLKHLRASPPAETRPLHL